MPGGIPTGSDPSYLTPHPFSVIGGMASVFHDRDEPQVRSQLETEVKNMNATKGQSDQVFAGLLPGLGLPGAIIKSVLQAIVGIPLNILSGGGLGAIFGAFGGIPTSQLSDRESENLLFNPQFNVDLTGWTPDPEDDWVQDSTQGDTNPGSVRVIADGNPKTLRSTRIPVVEGNEVKVSMAVKRSSGVGVANPIRLNLRLLDVDGVLISTQAIGSSIATGTADWATVSGPVFTVGATPKFVEVELKIESSMSSGTVWFDDVSLTKAGKIAQGLIAGLVEFLLDIPQTAVSGLTGIASNVVGWIGGFFKAVTGQDVPEEDVSAEQASEQAAALAEQLIANSTAIAEIQSGVEPTVSNGLSASDAFEREDLTGIGSGLWDENHTVTPSVGGRYMIVDGHNAAFEPGSDPDSEQFGVYRRLYGADAETLTSYQKITVVVGPFIGDSSFFGFGETSHFRIWCRLNSVETQGVFIDIDGDHGVQFGYRNGGADTLVGTRFTGVKKSAGTSFSLVAGTAGGVRQYQLLKGASVVASWNDAGSLSAVGASNRGWGFGFWVPDGSNKDPMSINSINVSDNEPASVLGTGITVYRAATSSGWSPASGDSEVADNFYDTVEFQTPDMVWDAVNSQVTVTRSGWYSASFSFFNSSAWSHTSASLVYGLMYVGGAVKRRVGVGPTTTADTGGAAMNEDFSIGGACMLYLTAGQIVKPGLHRFGQSINAIGDAGGTNSWFTLTKVS